MKIQILKPFLINSETNKSLKVGEIIEVSEARAQAAIKDGRAKEVKEENKAIVPNTEKKTKKKK